MSVVQDALASVAAPYPGPRPFTPSESDFFKGRDRESRDVRDLLLAYQVVVLYSTSGAGKSSLVNAGLRPLMIEEGIEVLPVARVGGKLPPGVDASKIGNIFAFHAISSSLETPTDPATMFRVELSEYLVHGSVEPRLLVFDQFEELFTAFPERWQDRSPFFLQLQRLCKADQDLRLLIVIREDHLAELDPFADLLPNALRIRYRLERLREPEALQAVVLPMAQAGYTFQEGVDKELVSNLTKIHVQTDNGEEKEVAGEFVEPVHLQVVCGNLWNNRPTERHTITAGDVRKFADVDQTLGEFYNRAVRLAAAGSRIRESAIRAWVAKKLITPGGTRALVYMGRTSTEGLPNPAVRILETERLVRAEPRSGAAWYELTHDRFIGPIRASNRTWLATHWRWRRVAQLAAAGAFLVLISVIAVLYVHKRQDDVRTEQEDAARQEMRQGRDLADDHKWDEALKHYNAALQLYKRLGDPDGLGSAYSAVGSACSYTHQYQDSASAYYIASNVHSSLDEKEAAANDLMGVGNAHSNSAEFDLAVKYHQQALDTFKQLGVDSQQGIAGQANALAQLGNDNRWLNKYAEAEGFLNQSLNLYGTLKEPQPRDKANAQSELASLYVDRGEYGAAIRLYKEARPVLAAFGDKSSAASAAESWGSALFYMGNLTEAFKMYKLGDEEYRAIDDKDGEASVLARFAQWYTVRNLCDRGIDYATQALTLAKQVNDSVLLSAAQSYKAEAYLCAKLLPQAEVEAQKVLDEDVRTNNKFGRAKDLETLALVAEARGDIPRAIENGEKSVALWDSIGSHSVYARRARANLARWKETAAK